MTDGSGAGAVTSTAGRAEAVSARGTRPTKPTNDFSIAPAKSDDRDAILAVMRPANMHHVPSPEMAELELDRFFVARADGRVVAAAGYKLLEAGRAKTTLLATLPGYEGQGIRAALQRARLRAMRELGVKTVTTPTDTRRSTGTSGDSATAKLVSWRRSCGSETRTSTAGRPWSSTSSRIFAIEAAPLAERGTGLGDRAPTVFPGRSVRT